MGSNGHSHFAANQKKFAVNHKTGKTTPEIRMIDKTTTRTDFFLLVLSQTQTTFHHETFTTLADR